jgi:hypothetical protein
MGDEISDQIEADALKPAEASGDMGSVKKRPLGELIQAERHVKGKDAAGQGHFGIRISKIVPSGGD